MLDPSFLTNIPMIFEQLQVIILLSDIMFYVVGILFFGSIARKGFRGYLNFTFSFGLRVVTGLISMVGGIALRVYFPQLSAGIFQIFNADILAGALVSSIILLIGLYLISFRLFNLNALEKLKDKIEERIKKAKKMKKIKRGPKDPVKIIGIAIIIGLVAFSLINLKELPLASDGFLSFIGMSREEFTGLSEQFENLKDMEGPLPEGCDSMLLILQSIGSDLTALPESSDTSVISLLESGSESSIVDVRETEFSGTTYYIGTTRNNNICHATQELFCGCLDVSEFSS